MQAYNPNEIQVTTQDLNDEDTVVILSAPANKIAYINLSQEARDFLLLCQETHGVIGFEYDFEQGGLKFGIILKGE